MSHCIQRVFEIHMNKSTRGCKPPSLVGCAELKGKTLKGGHWHETNTYNANLL